MTAEPDISEDLDAIERLYRAVEFLYSRLAGWEPSRDIPAKMEEFFGAVRTETFNLGTFFVACSRLHSPGAPRE